MLTVNRKEDIPMMMQYHRTRDMLNLIKEVYQRELELSMDGLDEFAISGHTEGMRFRSWQIFDKKRYELSRKR